MPAALRILVASADAELRRRAIADLAELGYPPADIDEAADGDHAFARLLDGGVRLALIDQRLPVLPVERLLVALARAGGAAVPTVALCPTPPRRERQAQLRRLGAVVLAADAPRSRLARVLRLARRAVDRPVFAPRAESARPAASAVAAIGAGHG